MINYQVEKILNDADLTDLKSLFDMLPEGLAHQDYNLFDVDKRTIPSKNFIAPLNKIRNRGENNNSLKLMAHYFVKYEKDSFTKMNNDDEKVVKQTIVTMIETKNLVGGDTLVLDKYVKTSRPKNKYAKRAGKKAPVNHDIIPDIVKLKDGESVIYDGKVLHGVTKVHEAHRIVLVSWFK